MNYYKARMYSPTLGRFMQTDPIGYGDGMNMYRYVANDPINGIDPSGTSGMSQCTDLPAYIHYRDYNGDGVPQSNEVVGYTPGVRFCTSPFDGLWGSTGNRSGWTKGSGGGKSSGKEKSQSDPCAGVPDPGPGRKVLNGNINKVLHERRVDSAAAPFATPGDARLRLFQRSVPGGEWDYKARISGAEKFGNFHFGALAGASGLSLTEALNWAQGAQIAQDLLGRQLPSGSDNPGDADLIRDGYRYFRHGCYK